MAEPDTGLVVRFESQRRETSQVIEWETESAYLQASDSFIFTLFDQDPTRLRRLELQPVELLVDGVSQCLGRIEVSEGIGVATARRFEGRDYISEIVECNVNPEKHFPGETELGVALTEVMRPLGITQVLDFEGVSMTELRTGKPIKYGKRKSAKKNKSSSFKPNPGEGIYQFCERFLARHGATLQPGPARNTVVISTPDYDQQPMFSLTRTDDQTNSAKNNVQPGAKARRDYTNFPTMALFTGTNAENGKQGAPMAVPLLLAGLAWGFNQELAEILEAGTTPGESREGDLNVLYRLLYHRDTDSRNERELRTAAVRAICERLKDTLRYTCTVSGHRDPTSGALWAVNAVCQVDDSIEDVHEPLWIARRRFRYGAEGAFTDLEMWRLSSFRLDGADL